MKDFKIEEFLPDGFSPLSRVWIYQANRLFFIQEAFQIEEILKAFTDSWLSHGEPVKGFANLFFGRFIVVMADEANTKVGGCSTDSSVRMIKQIEDKLKVNMFDRQLLCFYIKEKVEMIPLGQLEYAILNGFITEDTLYFNNTILTKEELVNNWITPAKNTWLKKYFVANSGKA